MSNDIVQLDEKDETAMEKFQHISSSFESGLNQLSSISTDVTTITSIMADLNRDIANMDHEIDALIIRTNSNMEKFSKLLPILETQIQNASTRLDKFADALLNDTSSLSTPEGLKAREMKLSALNSQSEAFNNMLMKILTY